MLSTCVQAAQRADPVSAADRDLLLAIPLNAPLPRPVLDGSEPVTALYDAVITSAERARHAAWVTGTQPAWSPHLTADSLRQVAATSTVTSHHCEILLRSLAARTADSDTAGLSARLLRAADAAGRARTAGCTLARALNQVDTDTMRHLAPTAGEAGDLALCTGRLAYADPAWTLSSGPGHQPRPPHDLAPHPGDVPLALAAAHHACDAVTSLAYAQRERIRTAASAGRLLVPTRSLPDTMDIPRPFAPALPDHIYALLRLCQDTAEAAAEASAQAGEAAAAVRAPSHLLTAARAAARAGRDASTSPSARPHPNQPSQATLARTCRRGPGRPAPARRHQPRPAAARSRHRPGQRAADHRSSRTRQRHLYPQRPWCSQWSAPASIWPRARIARSRTLITAPGPSTCPTPWASHDRRTPGGYRFGYSGRRAQGQGARCRHPAGAPGGATPASSPLIMRARAFSASLEPLTPPLRNARRDTGFPAAASLRATRGPDPPVAGAPGTWSRYSSTARGPGAGHSGPGRGPVLVRLRSHAVWSGLVPRDQDRDRAVAGGRPGCPAPPWPRRRRAACGPARSPWPGPGPAGRTRRW